MNHFKYLKIKIYFTIILSFEQFTRTLKSSFALFPEYLIAVQSRVPKLNEKKRRTKLNFLVFNKKEGERKVKIIKDLKNF